jgi:hypothetical protein
MKGSVVGVSRRLSMSPRVKIKVTAIMNDKTALGTTDHIIALGRVSEASWISSAVGVSAGSFIARFERRKVLAHVN